MPMIAPSIPPPSVPSAPGDRGGDVGWLREPPDEPGTGGCSGWGTSAYLSRCQLHVAVHDCEQNLTDRQDRYHLT